jgi:Uma2 family endonuclease
MATTAKLTLEEFLKLPETKPYSEYVDGEVRQKSTPTTEHGIIASLLSLVVGSFLRTNPLGICGTEIRCVFGTPGQELARLPDFVFISAARFARARLGPFRGAPDLAVEILSPDDRMVDVMEKVAFYLANGVRLVWLVNPYDRTVTVFASPTNPRVFTENDTLDGGEVLPGFSTVVREILPPAGLLAAEPEP